MQTNQKSQELILSKLGIEKLNPMQEEAQSVIPANRNIVLLSPTGTGKTLAFLLPLLADLDTSLDEIQLLILVPSRELALQIEQMAKEMGSGFKINSVYGGQTGQQDKINLKHRPAILIGTPGRVADHMRRATFSTKYIKTLVLDEFDKSLETGFETDMREIIGELPFVEKRILTSATPSLSIPDFVDLPDAVTIDYLHEKITQLSVKIIQTQSGDKLPLLIKTLRKLDNQPGIVFCNFKDTIGEVSDFLSENNIVHGCFYGGMEQIDRERSLIKFRNGTQPVLLATDLAARGIDVPEIKFIIHFELPQKKKEFTHRNGRTARMNKDGTAYILKSINEDLPAFISDLNAEIHHIEELTDTADSSVTNWVTLYISGGRRDKISKGDIAGLFLKQGKLEKEQLGLIEIKQDCAFVAVEASQVKRILEATNNSKLKKKKIRVSVA